MWYQEQKTIETGKRKFRDGVGENTEELLNYQNWEGRLVMYEI